MPLSVIQPPSDPAPFTLQELKGHLRIRHSHSDQVLDRLRLAVVGPTQRLWGVQIMQATLQWSMESWKRLIELPRPPLVGVELVEYRAGDGQWQQVDESSYRVNKEKQPGFIRFVNGYSLPATDPDETYPLRITYQAGHEDPDKVDPELALWMMNQAGTFYTVRSADLITVGTSGMVSELEKQMGRLVAGRRHARFG